MAPRRQRSSQRRKAVGLTQESLAQHLGVERSTVVRTIPALREFQSEEWLGRAEFEDLIRPQVAETVAASRSAGDGVGPDTPVPTTVGATGFAGGFAGSDVPEPAQTEAPHRPYLTAIRLDVKPADVPRRRARSRRFTRFAAAGVLALVGGAACVPLITSHSGSITPAAAGTPAPPAAIPAPNAGTSNDNSPRSEDSARAPAATPNKQAHGPAPSKAAAVPTPHTRSDNRTTNQSTSPASMMTPSPPRTPAIPAEAYAWSHTATHSANDQPQTHPRPVPPPHPSPYPHRGN